MSKSLFIRGYGCHLRPPGPPCIALPALVSALETVNEVLSVPLVNTPFNVKPLNVVPPVTLPPV